MAILVAGSTGVVGTQVLDHLRQSGAEVRALTRTPEKAQLPKGVTAVRGELADIDGLRDALKDVSTLFLLAPNAPDELTQAIQALCIARDSGVKGIVYLSVFKAMEYADVPHFTSKFAAERMIEQAGLPATILRPAYFMQNDVRQKEPLLEQGVYAMPIGAKGISMVDVRDIGDAAARELLRRERASAPLPRELYELVGPDAVNADFVTAAWTDALKRPIRHGGDDVTALETRLKGAAPAWLAFDMRLMMQRYVQDGAVATAAPIERMSALLGRPPRSYRDFAIEMASEWTRQ
ncbi:NmrA family transcriptional regulator [Burkholderia sp. 8Y]|uniref:SDR family oxidoreductase n=1 Tax=Burkholderia sp. 8Y TaxID=2653133 RepID=UPI0012F3A423|nr:NmrA family NAD(P)-binding protein [Burkholderia sp. 8Y]VXC97059.1 NmrA family transcriptional regulator [Burkholderia sp. 8Y]